MLAPTAWRAFWQTMLVASNFLVWTVVLLLAVALAALGRKVDLLHKRLGAALAVSAGAGLRAGAAVPAHTVCTLDGRVVTIGGDNDMARPVLLLFLDSAAPASRKLVPHAIVAAHARGLKVIFACAGEAGECQRMREELRMTSHEFVDSPELAAAYGVSEAPFAVLIGRDGRLGSKGQVATRHALEVLLAHILPGPGAAERVA